MIKTTKSRRSHRTQRYLEGIQYSIDFLTAVLLFTGQVSTSGIFVVPDGFFLSITGPILGGVTIEGLEPKLQSTLFAIDKVLAVLLVLNVVRVTGPYVTSGRVFIVVSGEIFGIKEIAGVAPVSDMKKPEANRLAAMIEDTMLNYTRLTRQRS